MSEKGFTLVELAIVLIIIGLITAGGLIGINSAMDSNKFNSTRNQIEGIIKSIAEYSATGQRIPENESAVQTFISPFTDNFGNPLHYIPASELTKTGSVCNTKNTSLVIRQCNNDGCTTFTEYSDVAFFVSSDSINKVQQTSQSVSGDNIYINIYTEETSTHGYDDITGFLTLNSLKNFAGCEGSTLEIIENNLPTAYTMSEYTAGFNVKGGTAPYSWCMESDDENVRKYFLLGTHELQEPYKCGTADSYQSTDTGAINLQSENEDDNGRLPTEKLPNVNKLTLYVKDSSGATASKSYALMIKDYYK